MHQFDYYDKEDFDKFFFRMRSMYNNLDHTDIRTEYKAFKSDFIMRGMLPVEASDWELEEKPNI